MNLADNNSRIYDINSIPNPVINTVQIKGKQVDSPSESTFRDNLFDVFCSDPCTFEIGRMQKCIPVRSVECGSLFNVFRIPVEKMPSPSVVNHYVRGYALAPIAS